jgi:hypothetical protein
MTCDILFPSPTQSQDPDSTAFARGGKGRPGLSLECAASFVEKVPGTNEPISD